MMLAFIILAQVILGLLLLPKITRRLLLGGGLSSSPYSYDRILVSIPYSHYVESARWAMERRGYKIWEIKVPIGPHATVVAMYRLLFKDGLKSRSSYPGEGFTDSWIPTLTNAKLRRLAGVPLVINTKTETCLSDSWSVLKDCDLHVNEAVQERWDNDFGPAIRQAGYYYIFQNKSIYRDVQSCHAFWMFFHDLFEKTMSITWFMKRMMSMTPKDVEKAEEGIVKEFERVSAILEKYRYLGDGTGSTKLGGGDVAFSALSGWLILPENFHNGQVNIPDKSVFPPKMKALMNRVASTKAAQHVHHCYQQRGEVVKKANVKSL